MVQEMIDHISFKMKAPFDFGFLSQYGRVFRVFDDQDSGNICFGLENENKKYFLKFAGAPTAEYNGIAADAIARLQRTLPVYQNITHSCLPRFLHAEQMGGGFAMLFEWAEGVCMGRMFPEEHRVIMQLPTEDKLLLFDDLLDFMQSVNENGYIAVDFYDGSIMYDPHTKCTTVCDIDFFRKMPVVNDMGRMWGSSRFMSPEEYELGARLDEQTNVFTMGKTAFSLFTDSDFSKEKWPLTQASYAVLCKATAPARAMRYQNIAQLRAAWHDAL